MPSIVTPSSSAAFRSRGASSPGSTITARSEPSLRNRKQFSAIWPTVNMRTSIGSALGLPGAGALRLALGSLLRLLADVALVHEPIEQEGHRDVEAEHQDTHAEGGGRALAEDRQQGDEEDRSYPPLLQRARPARRFWDAGSALLLGSVPCPSLRLGAAPRPPAGGPPVDASSLGAALLAATLLLCLRHRVESSRGRSR